MTGREGAHRWWSVGELARATGLTVRTLHHYDEVGLVQPSERTGAGHRRYTEPDVHRLYQVRLLRELGMPLGEIGEVLAGSSRTLREVLDRRLDEIDDQVWRLNQLSGQIRNLGEQLDGAESPTAGELLGLLGRTSVFHEQLTRDQRSTLGERSDDLGAVGRRWLDSEWRLVLTRLAEHCRAKLPVDDPEVVRTVRRLSTVLEKFAGDDPGIRAEMGEFFREHGSGVLRAVAGDRSGLDLGDELWDYVDRAVAHVRGTAGPKGK